MNIGIVGIKILNDNISYTLVQFNNFILVLKIFFEGNVLTNPEFIRRTIKRLETIGYKLVFNPHDNSDIILEKL